MVDDDELVRQMSVRALLNFGYHVDTAEDGAAGWEALQSGNHDLLLTDHNMPRMSGIELVKKVRIARMTLPAILASGALPTEELERLPWLEFAAILAKPFSPQELLATVEKALSAPDSARPGNGVVRAIPTANGRQSMPLPRRGR